MSSVPPRRLLALAIDDTVMSMVCPTLAKAGRLGMDGHRGDVLQLQVRAWRNRHAEALEHADKALGGEGRLGGLVAGAVEADHQAVANELVAA